MVTRDDAAQIDRAGPHERDDLVRPAEGIGEVQVDLNPAAGPFGQFLGKKAVDIRQINAFGKRRSELQGETVDFSHGRAAPN